MNEVLAKYLDMPGWPVMEDRDGRRKSCGDNYGDVECAFCDYVLTPEGSICRVGDACRKCRAEVVEIKPYQNRQEPI